MNAFVRVSLILERADGKLSLGYPGCEMLHGVNVETDDPPRWSWGGSVDEPTFHPSVLCHYP